MDLKNLLKIVNNTFVDEISRSVTDTCLLRLVRKYIEVLQDVLKNGSLDSNDNLESSREDLTEARDDHPTQTDRYNGMIDNVQITRIQQAVTLVGLDESFAITICKALSLRKIQFNTFYSQEQCDHFLEIIFPAIDYETQAKLRKLGVVLATCL